MKHIFSLLLLLITALQLPSCTPSRAACEKQYGPYYGVQTVYQRDTVVTTPEARLEVRTHYTTLTDTVYTQGPVQIRITRLPGETLHLRARCAPDTLRITVPVATLAALPTSPAQTPSKWRWFAFGSASMLSAYLIYRYGRTALSLALNASPLSTLSRIFRH